MLTRKLVFGTLAGVGLLLSTVGAAAAQMAPDQMPPEMPHTSAPSSFQRIEQPLWITGSVTAAGLALIGLEIWWFLLSKPTSRRTATSQDTQKVVKAPSN
ncbi:hypothetical protein [Leptolyngbya sp. FACHB-36]|uniref:hypothetical protein n=1 Tax=Leptolyngbya sp. FACHB-36 TaxID=2692808 RepID=UPI0018EFE104|nr:hypothetical protein [Leptolyngbya sp. FACHB-36]